MIQPEPIDVPDLFRRVERRLLRERGAYAVSLRPDVLEQVRSYHAVFGQAWSGKIAGLPVIVNHAQAEHFEIERRDQEGDGG